MEPSRELESSLVQVTCKKANTGVEFARGIQEYAVSVSGNNSINFSKSYFRIGLRLKQGANARQPVLADGIAFADNPCAGLFDNIYVRGNGATISNIVSFAAQADQIKMRTSKSRAWMNGVGKDAFGCNAFMRDRMNAIASDGRSTEENIGWDYDSVFLAAAAGNISVTAGVATTVTATEFTGVLAGDVLQLNGFNYYVTAPLTSTTISVIGPNVGATANGAIVRPGVPATEQADTQYFIWQPSVGLFDLDQPMYSGEYTIQCNPSSRYKTACVQTLAALAADVGYTLTVDSCEFYAHISKFSAPKEDIQKLYLNELAIQNKPISGANATLDFTVEPSTNMLIVWVQNTAAGSDSRYPITRFRSSDNMSDDIRNIQITYSGVSQPSTNWDSKYKPGTFPTGADSSTNYLVQRYFDSNDATSMLLSEGGCSSFAQYRAKGSYYAFKFDKTEFNRSTNVQLQITFGTASATDAQVFLASSFTRRVDITSKEGRIVSVNQLSV